MKAVILAAGRGSRLAPLTDDAPKGLLEVGGEALIEREIRLLRESGVDADDIHVVTGYLGSMIEERCPNVIPNDLWDVKDNSYSVLLALQCLGEDDYLFLDSDLLFEPALLHAVIECGHPNVFSGMVAKDTGESTGIETDGLQHVARIGKGVLDSGLVYTSIFKIDRAACARFRTALENPKNQKTWYTGALNDLLPDVEFLALPLDFAWCEIDDLDDWRHACEAAGRGAFR